MESGWKRLYSYPRIKRHTRNFRLLPRDAWRYERSKERYLSRPDCDPKSVEPITGEIGSIDSFRIIISQ